MEKTTKTKKRKLIIVLMIVLIVIVILCIICEFMTHEKTYYRDEKKLKIPIFVYHNIVDNESQIECDYMQTTKETFEKQMTGIMKLGYKPITYQDLEDYYNGKKAIYKHSFIVTFDDGFEGVYEKAFPIAKKYNIPMTALIRNRNV